MKKESPREITQLMGITGWNISRKLSAHLQKLYNRILTLRWTLCWDCNSPCEMRGFLISQGSSASSPSFQEASHLKWVVSLFGLGWVEVEHHFYFWVNGHTSLLFDLCDRVNSQYVAPSLMRSIYSYTLSHVTLQPLPLSEKSAFPYSVDVGIGQYDFLWPMG